jgi:hypothetical protein
MQRWASIQKTPTRKQWGNAPYTWSIGGVPPK